MHALLESSPLQEYSLCIMMDGCAAPLLVLLHLIGHAVLCHEAYVLGFKSLLCTFPLYAISRPSTPHRLVLCRLRDSE